MNQDSERDRPAPAPCFQERHDPPSDRAVWHLGLAK